MNNIELTNRLYMISSFGERRIAQEIELSVTFEWDSIMIEWFEAQSHNINVEH